MYLSRQLDEKQLILLKQGKGFFHIGGAGHEASGVAAALSLKPGFDYAYPYYRDQAFCLGLGMTSRDHLLSFLAKEEDPSSGGRQMPQHYGHKELNIISQSSPTGTQFLQAVGAGFALMRNGEKDIKNRLESMQENMKFANSYKRLPLMLNNSLALIEEDISKFTADHQLRIIESIDAIRNPENLDQISQLIMLDHSSDFTQKLAVLQKSLDHAKNIKINNLDESKLAGNEIAKHIRELRLKAIESNQ